MSAVIGDGQDILRDLSTFAAQIERVSDILTVHERGKEDGWRGSHLVLLDELGDGTDPVQGSALACAILERLVSEHGRGDRHGMRLAATTHLRRVRDFVAADARFTVAALAARRDGWSGAAAGGGEVNDGQGGGNAGGGGGGGEEMFRLLVGVAGTSQALATARFMGIQVRIVQFLVCVRWCVVCMCTMFCCRYRTPVLIIPRLAS